MAADRRRVRPLLRRRRAPSGRRASSAATAVRRLSRRRVREQPHPRQRAVKEHADGGEAGDDDGHGDLEPGPDEAVGVVPRRVRAAREPDDEAQPHAARDEHEHAQAEHDQDAGLAPPAGVQLEQQRHRQREDHEVLRDAEGGGGVGQRVDVEAVVAARVAEGAGAHPALPAVSERNALENLHEEEDDACRGDPGENHVRHNMESATGEDA